MAQYNCNCGDVNESGFQPRQTLAQLRRRLLIQTGFAAQADAPPASAVTLANEMLLAAQNVLYMDYPALRTRRLFRWSMVQGQRFYGLGANDDGYAVGTVTMTIATPCVVTWAGHGLAANTPISFTTTGALPTGLVAGTTYYVLAPTTNTFNLSAAPAGAAIATSGTQSGVHTATAIPVNCQFLLNPYKVIEWVGVQIPGGAWIPMYEGIPPEFYTVVNQQGIPSRYEIRECIEVLPAPNAAGYYLWVKGEFGLASFASDSDQTTIDSELVLLWAVANRKAAQGSNDANNYAAMAKSRLGTLTAGTHGKKRYVPGTSPVPPAAMPLFLPTVGP